MTVKHLIDHGEKMSISFIILDPSTLHNFNLAVFNHSEIAEALLCFMVLQSVSKKEVRIPNKEVHIPNKEVRIPNKEVRIPNKELRILNKEVRILNKEEKQ